ncbi:hypothetical protein GQ473_04540 [archaeon]|nr:hypothetical protein [archaeon]
MKKAFFSFDMIVSLVIFVMAIAASFSFLSYISTPKDTFVDTIKSSADDLAEKIKENASWSVYRMPILINSPNTTNATIEKIFYYDSNTDTDSIIIENENLSEINSDFSNNTVIFSPLLTAGQNLFYLIYTKNTNLTKRTYSTDLNTSDIWVNNSLMNVSFSTTGLTNIEFGGSQIIGGSGVTLETTTTPTLELGKIRAKKTYDNGIDVKIYNNNSKIIVVSNHTINPIIYVSKSYTNQYNGSVNSITTSGLQFNSIVNMVDVYGSSGIAVIGNNLNVSLYNNTYNEIRIYNTTNFEIYIHDGTYTNALVECDMYVNPPNTTFLIPQDVTGISYDSVSLLNTSTYSTLKNYFYSSVNFNMTVSNFSIGTKRPKIVDVIVIKYPISVVDRFSKINQSQFDLAVWL